MHFVSRNIPHTGAYYISQCVRIVAPIAKNLVVAMSMFFFSFFFSVSNRLIMDHAGMVRVLVFCYKIDCISMDLGILNLKGHHNFMIGSKVTVFLHTY